MIGDVGERPVSVVSVEHVPPKRGDVEVGVPVVVDVADRHPHAVFPEPEASLVGDIDEAEVSGLGELVSEELMPEPIATSLLGGLSGRGRRAERRPLQQVDVEVTVDVVVDQRDARPHDLGQVVLARRTADVLEVETGLGCGIPKDRGRRLHRRRGRLRRFTRTRCEGERAKKPGHQAGSVGRSQAPHCS